MEPLQSGAMGRATLTVQMPRLLLGSALESLCFSSGCGFAGVELGWELPEPGPYLGGAGSLPASLLHALEKEERFTVGGGALRGGRFEVAVVGHCQPKITMGRWGGWNPGGQPLPWLAALLVSPVLWPGTANKKPTRPVLKEKLAPLPWFLLHCLFLHCAEQSLPKHNCGP